MTFPEGRWVRTVRIAGLCAVLMLMAGTGARAEPVDAVPLDRPGTRMGEPMPPEPLAAPLPAIIDASPEGAAAPALGTSPLRAPEPALARIGFPPEEAALSDGEAARLKTFADDFRRRGGRVTLKAYAGAPGDTSTNARRLSLKRVLTVRNFLIEHGIATDRLEVRALGGTRDAGPLDRVDITRAGS
ncbi:MAG TPA: OmpA family protein [Parvibaculum sp.]|uniref:OmpA family protein n=1 Tax=Parvibaculum sp. TaxID=2024848 RepID=UPI002B65E2F5|nr:OmpA family protein [Parvibaculum sp.]HMM13083.1 OmpA family protein [Parvibaculum sp.]